MPKRIYHKEIKRGPGEVSARQALKMIASQQPEWTDNPANKLFPFYIQSEKKKLSDTSGTGQSNEPDKIELKRKYLYKTKKKIFSQTKILKIDGISQRDVEIMWRALKKSAKIIMDAIHGDKIEIKKCVDLELRSDIDDSYYNVIRRKSWTLFCTGYFPINEGGKTKYYHLIFRKRDIKKLIDLKIFQKNKWYRDPYEFEFNRISDFIKGPMLRVIAEYQGEAGQSAVPKFTMEQRIDIATIAMTLANPDETETEKERREAEQKQIAREGKITVSEKALKNYLRQNFPANFSTARGKTAEQNKEASQKIMKLIKIRYAGSE